MSAGVKVVNKSGVGNYRKCTADKPDSRDIIVEITDRSLIVEVLDTADHRRSWQHAIAEDIISSSHIDRK